MNDISPFGSAGDVLADDLLLDRLAGRADVGSEPVAGLLAALAAHADTPLPARTGRRRIANKHRYLGAFAALAVAASGAGVAAAVTRPHEGSLLADRARIEQRMEQSARSGAPSALLSRLGLPATDGTTTARGLVLSRGTDGTFVLLPAAVAQARTPAVGAAGAAAAGGGAGHAGTAGTGAGLGTGSGSGAGPSASGRSLVTPAAGRDKSPKDKHAKPARTRPGADTGNRPAGNGQGADARTADPAGQTAGDPIWVVDPSAGTTGTTTDQATPPTDATVAGPAPVAGRLADPANQQSLVGPPTSPQTSPQTSLQPGQRAGAPALLLPARPGAAHPVGATPATPARPATPATPARPAGSTPATAATPATPATPGARGSGAAASTAAPAA